MQKPESAIGSYDQDSQYISERFKHDPITSFFKK